MKLKILIVVLFVSNSAFAGSKFAEFLKSCGYGALIGAGVGVVTLALENKPSEHFGSVARGASLGLYAGIAYGLYESKKQPDYNMRQDYEAQNQLLIVPKFEQARLDGVEVGSTVYRF